LGVCLPPFRGFMYPLLGGANYIVCVGLYLLFRI